MQHLPLLLLASAVVVGTSFALPAVQERAAQEELAEIERLLVEAKENRFAEENRNSAAAASTLAFRNYLRDRFGLQQQQARSRTQVFPLAKEDEEGEKKTSAKKLEGAKRQLFQSRNASNNENAQRFLDFQQRRMNGFLESQKERMEDYLEKQQEVGREFVKREMNLTTSFFRQEWNFSRAYARRFFNRSMEDEKKQEEEVKEEWTWDVKFPKNPFGRKNRSKNTWQAATTYWPYNWQDQKEGEKEKKKQEEEAKEEKWTWDVSFSNPLSKKNRNKSWQTATTSSPEEWPTTKRSTGWPRFPSTTTSDPWGFDSDWEKEEKEKARVEGFLRKIAPFLLGKLRKLTSRG